VSTCLHVIKRYIWAAPYFSRVSPALPISLASLSAGDTTRTDKHLAKNYAQRQIFPFCSPPRPAAPRGTVTLVGSLGAGRQRQPGTQPEEAQVGWFKLKNPVSSLSPLSAPGTSAAGARSPRAGPAPCERKAPQNNHSERASPASSGSAALGLKHGI